MSQYFSEQTPVKRVSGDLLEAKVDCIFGQYNCITITSLGLALSTSQKYPYADMYSHRRRYGRSNKCLSEDEDKPGTCKIAKPGEGQTGPYVACLFSQHNPGKPSFSESTKQREKWFLESLTNFTQEAKDLNIKTIGIPFNIGCGLAGGNWVSYYKMIHDFALANPQWEISIYKI